MLNIILVAVVVVILGETALLLTRGGGGVVDGGVPPEGVDRGDNGAPQGPDDEEEAVDTETYGDGEVKVTLIVEVPDWTPPEDVVIAQVDGFYGATGWGVPMEEL
jgi:hypothetical protein